MQHKWQEYSMIKQGFILIISAFVLYQLASNTEFFVGAIRRFLSILTPFIIGAFLAYFLSRPVLKMEAKLVWSKWHFIRKKASIISVLSIFLVVILAVTILVSYVTPIITRNLMELIDNLPIYYEEAIAWLRTFGEDRWFYEFIPQTPAETGELIGGAATAVADSEIIAFVTPFLGTLVANIVTLTNGLINFVLGLVVALYLLLHRGSVIGLIDRIATVFIKPPTLVFIKNYLRKSNEVFYQFISAQFLDACILGTLATILLAVLRVEYAVTLGLLLGICNMIPFFGSIFASLVATIITLFTGGFHQAFLLLGCLLVLQQIDANFISPKITGDALGLNPLLIVASIFIGGAYFGVLGMFLAVPVAAMCRIFLDDYLTLREKKLGIKKPSRSTFL